jgi:hypothetical protein
MPMSEIASACGFGNIRRFNKTFQKALSPYSQRSKAQDLFSCELVGRTDLLFKNFLKNDSLVMVNVFCTEEQSHRSFVQFMAQQ